MKNNFLVGIFVGGLFVAGALVGVDAIDGAGAATTKAYIDPSGTQAWLSAEQSSDLDAVIGGLVGCTLADPAITKEIGNFDGNKEARWTVRANCVREIKALSDVPVGAQIQVFEK